MGGIGAVQPLSSASVIRAESTNADFHKLPRIIVSLPDVDQSAAMRRVGSVGAEFYVILHYVERILT
jgi:hypothetical protein